MIPPFDRPFTSRAVSGIIAGFLLVIALYTFYTAAALPTDENIFTTTPSFVMIDGGGQNRSQTIPAGLQRGDLVLAVNDKVVRKMGDWRSAIGGAPTDSVRLRILRAGHKESATVPVSLLDLAAGTVTGIPPVVVVTDILPGGASDRAGMKVGDFIVKINGQTFTTAQEADQILRRGTSGAAIAYDIIRQGEPLQLTVTLARFGIPLGLLVFFLAGLVFMFVGSFLLMNRPTAPAALTIGYWFLLIGFVLAVATHRREPDPTWFTSARDVLLLLAAYLGVATGFHSHYLFPVDRRQPWHRRWLFPVSYIVALVSPALLLTGEPAVPWMLLTTFVVVQAVVTVINPKPLTVQQKKIVLPLRLAVAVAGGGSFGLLIILGLVGLGRYASFAVLLTLLVPLSYLYVIGRYRLLDLDLRIRRNVQYTVISWVWGILVAGLLVRVFLALPAADVQVPGITITGLSVEIGGSPISPGQQVFLERLVMMVAGAVVWFLLWRLQKAGQQFIARRYDQTQFDYRRAASDLADVLSARLTMKDIAQGVTASLAELLKLKTAGLLVFQDERSACCEASIGVDPGVWQRVIASADSRFVESVAAHAAPFRSEELPEEIRAMLAGALIHSVVPIRSKERLVGVLLAGEKMSESPHSAEDHAFLSGVSKQVSMAIDNAFLYEDLAEQERLRHELAIARRIQLSSLPSGTPHFPGLEIAGISAPAQEVGGDFYDYLNGQGRGLTVVVGDVSGKGTSAALYMAKVQGILRSLHGFELSPRELFLRANRLLCRDLEKSSFVTALGIEFAPALATARLVRAGHIPLFIYRSDSGTVERVVPRGLGLGLNDAGVFAAELEERTIMYRSGDLLILVTDGVVEARNGEDDEYGESRVVDAVVRFSGRPAAEVRDGLLEDLKAFGGGADQHDDQTVVVVRAL